MHYIKNTVKAYLCFLIMIPIITIIYTLIIYFLHPNINQSTLSIISLFVIIFIFFIFGIIVGLCNQKKGLLCGAVSTLILFGLIVFINLICHSFDFRLLIKALLATFTAGLGGLIGINLKKK